MEREKGNCWESVQCYDVRNKVPLRIESPKCRQRVVQNYQCARFISLNNNRTKANAIHTCKRKLSDCQERIEHLRRPVVDLLERAKKKNNNNNSRSKEEVGKKKSKIRV